jgi:RNA polymerase sigma-70 factor, ECF subfamily
MEARNCARAEVVEPHEPVRHTAAQLRARLPPDRRGKLVTAAVDERVRALLDAGAHADAATEAIRALGPAVLRYVRTLLRDEADANDAFSYWAESVWSGLPGYRGDASVRTWSFRLAYHAALAVLDQAWRRRVRPFATGEASRLAETLRTASAVRVERQRRKLDAVIGKLSAEQQTLLSLRVDQGLSWEEVADVLSTDTRRVDPGTVAKRYERLKVRLAAELSRNDE